MCSAWLTVAGKLNQPGLQEWDIHSNDCVVKPQGAGPENPSIEAQSYG